jgi:hypothetical protein
MADSDVFVQRRPSWLPKLHFRFRRRHISQACRVTVLGEAGLVDIDVDIDMLSTILENQF